MIRYIDVRAKGSRAIFKMEPEAVGFVRLTNIDTRRSHLEVSTVFNRAYDAIEWDR